MILFAQHFRSHVAWSATGLLRVFLLEVPSDSEVGYSEIALLIENDILWFDIPMDYVTLVEIVECLK